MSVSRQYGFTLPEVMIALLVFAAIASASVYALRLGVDSRDQLAAADERLKSFQIARTLIKEDLAQVAARNVRDEFGQPFPAAFRGNIVEFGGNIQEDETLLLAFVRHGWRNPNAATPRSSLQYVEYLFKGGALVRRSRIYLDEAARSDTSERVLFEGLEDARASFLIGETRGELEWADIWPVSNAVQPPAAVSLMLIWPDRAPLEQRFWIGGIGNAS
ncbi:type II secretion system minor pseudopilin GspJ [Hyphococcus sp.]|uniref:type II secretion system minor pseudopilin GspJ n=1 Tax=Hyphococcus sp. TaxID=2038636 RepID=UPI003CCC1346